MPARITNEVAKQTVINQGTDTFVELILKNNGKCNVSWLKLCCPYHGIYEITWGNYTSTNKNRCKKCAVDSLKITEVRARKFVKNRGEDRFIAIFSRYNTSGVNETWLRLCCNTHGEYEIRWYSYVEGNRCRRCGLIKKGLSKKISIPHAKKFVESIGLDNFINISIKNGKSWLTLQCKTHNNIYEVNWSNYTAKKQNRCTKCSRYGYNKHKPGTFYVYKIIYRNCYYIGFGISNNFARRDKEHRAIFNENNIYYELIHKFYHENGENVLDFESTIKNVFKHHEKINIIGFKSESFPYEFYDIFLTLYENFFVDIHQNPL